MDHLTAAVDRTVAERTTRLRQFVVFDGRDEWWEQGRGAANMADRRTHLIFRPIPPYATPPGGFTHETEYEYLFDGGRRWAKGGPTLVDKNSGRGWHAALGVPDKPRQIGDPMWVLDALAGANTIEEPRTGGEPITARLDLAVAERVTGHPIDLGRGRTALLWRPRLRRWRRAVSARVWLDGGGRLARVEHYGPPPGDYWVAVVFEDLGEPVELPEPPPAASG